MRIQGLLAGLVLIATASLIVAQPNSTHTNGTQSLSRAPQPATHAQPAANLLDINTATPQQLKALPGFGDAYVRRVIAGRPYTAKNQLVTRGVLPQAAYAQVSPFIVAHRPAK